MFLIVIIKVENLIKLTFFKDITLWTEWSICSLTCGTGEQTRTRNCSLNCDGVSSYELFETKTCNDFICQYTMWSEWSNCSLTCGSGEQTRTRNCQKTFVNCERVGQCCYDLLETKICNDFICPGELDFFQKDDKMETFISF